MDSDRLAEIRQRADAATPGPWEAANLITNDTEDTLGRGPWGVRSPSAEQFAGCHPSFDIVGCEDTLTGPDRADAEFIAHARRDTLELLAEVHGLRDCLNEANWMLENCRDESNAEIDRLTAENAELRRVIAGEITRWGEQHQTNPEGPTP